MTVTIRFLLGGVLFGGMCAAHDLYLLPEHFEVKAGGEFDMFVLNGDEFPQPRSAPRLDRLSDFTLHSADRSTPIEGLRVDDRRAVARVSGGSGFLFVTITSTPRVEGMESGEFHEYLAEEGLDSAISWRAANKDDEPRERYTKYAKTIVRAGSGGAGFSRPVGLPIEFVPQADPLNVKSGGTLPVLVFYKGKPAPGLQVIAASTLNPEPEDIGRTDANGLIQVPIAGPSQWRLHTVVMDRVENSADYNWESFWATLTFEVR